MIRASVRLRNVLSALRVLAEKAADKSRAEDIYLTSAEGHSASSATAFSAAARQKSSFILMTSATVSRNAVM
jgi:hypothetical protein